MCVHTTYATVLRTEIIHITFLLHLEIYEAIVMSELPDAMMLSTDYGHPERAFFRKFETFGLGQTNWAENL